MIKERIVRISIWLQRHCNTWAVSTESIYNI